jgi:RNA polymerase subunit RPABC4/transcription elongation factor Spt4
MTALAPCKTCSRLYRANRVRCTVCGFWRSA